MCVEGGKQGPDHEIGELIGPEEGWLFGRENDVLALLPSDVPNNCGVANPERGGGISIPWSQHKHLVFYCISVKTVRLFEKGLGNSLEIVEKLGSRAGRSHPCSGI